MGHIMAKIDIARERIAQLVKDFKTNESHYQLGKYSEAEVRKDYIDKFWIALGWDVNHDTQTNPYEQEVKVERGVVIGGTQRRADYAFYLSPNFHDVHFLVEAKKPSGDIASIENYFQIIRYGWNSNTPIAVLTDFAQLHVLDCRYRPDVESVLSRAWKKFHYSDFVNSAKFAEIYWLFSREAVAESSIEKRAKELPKPRGKAIQRGLFPGGYQSIDESFLAELDDYRTSLARTFKRENLGLDSETLTELAQRTLDRLVFLRFLEDKGIEPKRLMERFGEKGTAWADFTAASRRLDGIYNGIVYKRHEILDSPTFNIDDNAFAEICEKLSHINSPYDFNAIPIHILGSIYERFLGKVIVATEKRAKVEEKPEVRKAGGVYYTPEYIVRFIVENTVGTLISGKTPDQIAEMRFADISCGSGSFLLGVFDLLLKYHGQYYNDNPSKARKGDCHKRDGRIYLSLRKKREILLNNIFGVDVDAQAVEVCQLSLYLKLLQDETEATAQVHQLEFHETLLPPLAKNIICGNSLVERDINCDLFGEERKLNPMTFVDAFPEVMKHGGFSAIVGNPPWGASFGETELAYFRGKYKQVIARTVDSYIYFIGRALQLVRPKGVIGYIIPSTILNQVDAKPIRGILISNNLSTVVSLGTGVFGTKVLNTSTIVITSPSPSNQINLKDISTVPPTLREKSLFVSSSAVWGDWLTTVKRDPHLTFFVNHRCDSMLLTRLRDKYPTLGDLVPSGIQRGVSPDIVKAHVVTKKVIDEFGLEPGLLKPSIGGRQIKRYREWKSDQYIIYTTSHTELKKYPQISGYLEQFRGQNSCPEVKAKKHPWWALHRPRDPEIFASPKIIGLTTAKTIELILDQKESLFVTDAMYVFRPPTNWEAPVIMAIMQSRLFLALYRVANQGESRVIPQVKASKLSSLPVPVCRKNHPMSKKLSQLATSMSAATSELAKVQTDKDKDYWTGKCSSIDRQINHIVYELYELSDEEIELIENSTL
jgi:adenine-specific DNA-methyltransferase